VNSIEELTTPVTSDQQLETFLSILETTGLKPRSWREGGSLRTILRIVASTFAAFSSLQAGFIRGAFLELSEGVWLTLLAFYVYGVTRREATFATGEVTLTNSGGGNYTFAAGQLRVFNPTTKKAYTNVNAFTLAPLATQKTSIVAAELGSASSSPAGAISDLETQYDGVSVTNEDPVVGLDAATDPELRQLCRDKRAGRSVYGPRGAYAYAVRSTTRADGTPANINRLSISPSSSTGIVTIYIASPTGAPDAGDIALVLDSVNKLARADTATASVLPAVTHAIARTLTVWAEKRPGLSASDLESMVAAKLLSLNATYPIGGIPKTGTQGYLYASTIDGTAKGTHEAIYAVDGVGTDVALAANEVAILSVTVTARIVDSEVHT
jgi:Baseplate J-like protein